VEIGSQVLAVHVAIGRKDKTKNKRHAIRSLYFTGLVGAPPLIRSQPNLVRLFIVDPLDVITLAKYEITLFIIVTLVSG